MSEEFEAAVGMSRKWDAREAGREVAESTIRKLHRPPDFFLLFSTIHYEKHGGFQEFLKGVWEVLPKETPLIGGTVAGFINNYGCYTRGATGLAICASDIEVSHGSGSNTKRNPKNAVSATAENLDQNEVYKNNIIIEVCPTAVIPSIPGFGQKNVILSRKIGSGFVKLLPLLKRMNYGYDRADEIIELLAERYKKRIIIGGCTMDDNKFLCNYQFHGKKVGKNTLLALNVSIPNNVLLKTIIGYKNQETKFKIDAISKDRHVVSKMDGMGARSALSKKLNLNIEEKEAVYQLYKHVYYYPLGFKKDEIWHASMIGLIYGENLIFGNIIENRELTLLTVSIEETMKKIKESLNEFSTINPSCIFGFACETFMETLRKNIFEIQDSMKKLNTPFLIPFVAGESVYNPEKGAHHLYESLNLIAIGS